METSSGPVTRLGLVQTRVGERPAENLERALDLVADAAREGAEVVCLPELFQSPYPCQSEDPERFECAALWREWCAEERAGRGEHR